MTNKKLVKTTTHRGEFNRAYKIYLEQKALIHCSYCPYHRHENDGRRYYGGYRRMNGHLSIRFPNWKLVSKNRKQWMEKPIKIITEVKHDREYTEIKF
jgi:hypothetical protein